MLLKLMWVSLVDPWLWQIIVRIFRNLPGGPTMWSFEDHIACMKKIIQVSSATFMMAFRIEPILISNSGPVRTGQVR